jgi:hypothetical protein
MAFWIVTCSPDNYQRSEQLANPGPAVSWKATQCPDEIWPGATAFIWKAAPHRGIRAVMRIDEAPRESMDLPSEQLYSCPPSWGSHAEVEERSRSATQASRTPHFAWCEASRIFPLLTVTCFSRRRTSRSMKRKERSCYNC